MQKIMFNDMYGLTDRVLSRAKTQTRRVITSRLQSIYLSDEEITWKIREENTIKDLSRYKIGEEVAVAQSYKDLGYTKEWVEQHISPNPNAKPTDPFEKKYPGWNNKMFVKADLMPHRIRITDIKVERLQDISDEDCLKEGIIRRDDLINSRMEDVVRYVFENCFVGGIYTTFATPRGAFAALIDNLSGKGTWGRNEWQFAYSFKLIR